MKMTVNEAAAWLLERDDFLLLTHVRPDGDTLCSAAALARALRSCGKNAWLLENPETTHGSAPGWTAILRRRIFGRSIL